MIERPLRLPVPWWLAGVIVTQVGDLVTFLAAIGRTGIDAEQNALARTLFLRAGDAGPLLLKVAAVLVLVLLVRRVSLRFPAYAAPAGLLAVGLGVIGMTSNVLVGLIG